MAPPPEEQAPPEEITRPRRPKLPRRNLILTGFFGVGRRETARIVSERLAVPFVDMDAEIEKRQGMALDDIGALFGEARVRALEAAISRELSLLRGAIITTSGRTMMTETNRAWLASSGPILNLTCALGEALRRLHVLYGARFHDAQQRAQYLARLKREFAIKHDSTLAQLDTTRLSVEQMADRAIAFWREQTRNDPLAWD